VSVFADIADRESALAGLLEAHRDRGVPTWIPDVHIDTMAPAHLYQRLDGWFRSAIAAWDIDDWFQREILHSTDRPLRVSGWLNDDPSKEVPRPFVTVTATHLALRDKCHDWLCRQQPSLNEIFKPTIAAAKLLSREEAVALGWDTLDWKAARASAKSTRT
jgi:hypothetical protein